MLNVLLIFTANRNKKGSLEDLAAEIQNGNKEIVNQILEDYKPFVKKAVSSVCKRYIYESDDEFSIGLIAFHDAIYKYDSGRGASFLSFAEVIIKRKVIDYIRMNGRHRSLSMEALSESKEGETRNAITETLSMEEYDRDKIVSERKEEIMAFSKQLKKYSLSFEDLVKISPKHEDARMNAISIAEVVASTPSLLEYLEEKKRLPIKQLEKEVGFSRKTIERNRKYIIAITLILMGDFYYLKDYLKGRMKQ
ncbi:RNA polymerase sigma-I factor [Bacillus salacetis]|uniref:RNA polymerase sigma factor SigI n=1 Tax=Bacillus salacetis TaxID=2315464 RepID=A0A3A1QSA7_9BACI|nr:RNA polymerase sigma-I factor [Bacillus salacetis]RIW30173.1 RNA polymerase sigma-I factor [Bacillus salacetis]